MQILGHFLAQKSMWKKRLPQITQSSWSPSCKSHWEKQEEFEAVALHPLRAAFSYFCHQEGSLGADGPQGFCPLGTKELLRYLATVS